MKTLYLLLFILTAATITAHAQQRTRDILFPEFQKDIAAKRTKTAAADPRKTATSTRSLLFTNYQRPRSSSNSNTALRRPVSAGGVKQASDLSVTEARKAIKPVKIEKTPIQQQP